MIEGVELLWKKKSGEHLVVSLYARTLRNARGRVVGYEGMVLDVTERRRAEAALATLSRQVLEAHETERHRLAHKLHDELGQDLTALKLLLQMVEGTPATVARRLPSRGPPLLCHRASPRGEEFST